MEPPFTAEKMGKTTIAVTKRLLEQVLQLPAGVHIVGVGKSPYEHSVDIIIEGLGVPNAARSRATVYREALRYEFVAVEEKNNGK